MHHVLDEHCAAARNCCIDDIDAVDADGAPLDELPSDVFRAAQ